VNPSGGEITAKSGPTETKKKRHPAFPGLKRATQYGIVSPRKGGKIQEKVGNGTITWGGETCTVMGKGTASDSFKRTQRQKE